MTPKGKRVTAVLLIVLLALPTGLCSLVFTPLSIGSFFARDSLERSIGSFALVCSLAGWLICGVSIWAAVRLQRTHLPPPTAQP